MKYALVPSELQECKAYWQWSMTIPLLRDYLYKITNEGKRTLSYGRNLKDSGLRAGLPDYHYPVANNGYHGFWLEMKKRNMTCKNVPDHQLVWIEKLLAIGHHATIGYG